MEATGNAGQDIENCYSQAKDGIETLRKKYTTFMDEIEDEMTAVKDHILKQFPFLSYPEEEAAAILLAESQNVSTISYVFVKETS